MHPESSLLSRRYITIGSSFQIIWYISRKRILIEYESKDSKEEGKYQESIQSSTTPDQGRH